jgi:tetratricopeptide (TPR) repeat protein
LSYVYQNFGKYERGVEAGAKSFEADPDFAPGSVNLAWSYIFLDRLAEAETAVQRALRRKLTHQDLFLLPYYIGFLKDDRAAMDHAFSLGKDKPNVEDWTNGEAYVLAYHGHLQESRRMAQRAIYLATQAHEPERAGLYKTGVAIREAFFGNAAAAQRNAASALESTRSRDVEYGVAVALALAGNLAKADTLANGLDARYPEDSIVRFTYLPVVRGLAAVKRGEPGKAIELLESSRPYDLGVPGCWFGFYGNLYPVYVRGEAFLTARRPAEAAAEFQKIIDHRAIVFADPVGIAARVQLGRAWVMAGDQAKARSAYEAFLDLWKDADRDIPILEKAKAEYAKLGR